jgi:DNA-binding NtrC family response regulator
MSGTALPASERYAVLLVDDDESYRFSLSVLLEEEVGLEVDVASSHESALEKLRARGARYSLVLLDQALGSEAGEALVPFIRRLLPDARIIILSGADPAEAVRRQVDGVLLKSFSVPHLLDEVGRQVGALQSMTRLVVNRVRTEDSD